MGNKDYIPPASRSGEINLLNEAIQVAVHSTIQAMGRPQEDCRQELDAIRGEIKAELGDLRTDIKAEFHGIRSHISEIRSEVGDIKVDMADGKTSFALINQRMQIEKEARISERDDRRRVLDPSPPKGYRQLPAAAQPTPVDPDDKPIIPPKIMNTLILAIVAAMGASIWAMGSAWLSSKVDTKATTTTTLSTSTTATHTPP